MTLLRKLDFWDMLLAGSCLTVVLYAAVFVPNFLSAFNLSQLAASASEKALLILPMALLIITREIDLSVASMLALTSVVFGLLVQAGVPTL
ncbi:MAG: ABC transporter permease, partial [Cypionkella sp.]